MTDVDTGSGKPNFAGKWKWYKDDGNFEDYLAANGAPWIARKAASATSPVQVIEHDGEDKFKISITTFLFTTVFDFTVGEEFDEKNHAGGKMKVQSSWDGDKLVLKFYPEDSDKVKNQCAIREVKGDDLIQTMIIGDDEVKVVRYFKRQ